MNCFHLTLLNSEADTNTTYVLPMRYSASEFQAFIDCLRWTTMRTVDYIYGNKGGQAELCDLMDDQLRKLETERKDSLKEVVSYGWYSMIYDPEIGYFPKVEVSGIRPFDLD